MPDQEPRSDRPQADPETAAPSAEPAAPPPAPDLAPPASPAPPAPFAAAPGNGRGAAPQGGFDVEALLRRLAERSAERFRSRQMIKSFQEFLCDLHEHPERHVRNAPQYLYDMFVFFGSREVPGIGGKIERWNVFDSPSTGGKGRVFGQERAQAEIVKYVRTFAEKGKVDKLLMLHGPNGSSKSTTVECIMRGLEQYSREPEGTLYRFNWIFSDVYDHDKIGFGTTLVGRQRDTYAHIEPEEVSSRVVCELRDNPIFLIPRDERWLVLRDAYAAKGLDPERIPAHILEGDLCQKCREIYDTLLNAYQGDWKRVVQHVQVERFFISKRYRVGAVVIEPQGNVDATLRPLGYGKQLHVPPVLQTSALFEPCGDLVDANRGLVEYSDFFKRHLEASKYLLTTIEKNTISLPSYMAYLDVVMMATSNEKQLCLFKRDPDFSSFKGRFELIKEPYLVEFSKEMRIYDEHLRALGNEKHVAPHTAFVASLWAVLTRLKRPRSKNYPGSLGNIVGKLTPIQKAYLYDRGQPPDDLTDQERRELLANLEKIRGEFEDHEEEFEGLLDAAYEGRRGASPREMQTLLADAAAFQDFPCLSPLAVLRALRELVKDVSVYDFLRLTPQSGYCDSPRFIDDVEAEWRKIVEEEIQDALGLAEEREYQRLFEDYFAHVRAFVRGEKVRNRQTGEFENPNEDLMSTVEKAIDLKEKPDVFRKGLVTRIAAYSIEHPGQKIDTRALFGDLFKALKADFYKKREKQIEQLLRDMLKFGTDDWKFVATPQREAVKRSLARLKARYGYCLSCAKETVQYVLKQRLK
jgi:predicted Ser/Thr protein kinase